MAGRADRFFKWGAQLEHLYKGLVFVDHAGGHEAPREEAVNAAIAVAVWDGLGLRHRAPG